jgi:hypothetical protein
MSLKRLLRDVRGCRICDTELYGSVPNLSCSWRAQPGF